MIVAAVAATLAAGGAGVITHATRPPVTHQRVSPHTWDELTQKQVDALTAALKKLPPRPVAIFCKIGCDDLALSFDNAFESAHWASGIETPLVDDTVGISVGCAFREGKCPADDPGAVLAATLREATGGALDPKLVDAHLLEGRIALVIGRR